MKKDTLENIIHSRRCSPTGRRYPPLRVVANYGRPPRLRAAGVLGDSTTISASRFLMCNWRPNSDGRFI